MLITKKILLGLTDLAEILGLTEDALSQRLTRDPGSLPPRWRAPGSRRKKREARTWHRDDVALYLDAGRTAKCKGRGAGQDARK